MAVVQGELFKASAIAGAVVNLYTVVNENVAVNIRQYVDQS